MVNAHAANDKLLQLSSRADGPVDLFNFGEQLLLLTISEQTFAF